MNCFSIFNIFLFKVRDLDLDCSSSCSLFFYYFSVGAIMESDARPTGVQLKSAAKPPTVIGFILFTLITAALYELLPVKTLISLIFCTD